MAHDRKRPQRRSAVPATSRVVLIIIFLNTADVIIATGQVDPRAWWVVLGVFIVSAVCVAALLASRRRR